MTAKPRISFIGVGNMGQPMGHLKVKKRLNSSGAWDRVLDGASIFLEKQT